MSVETKRGSVPSGASPANDSAKASYIPGHLFDDIPEITRPSFLDFIDSTINAYFYFTSEDGQVFRSVGSAFWRIWGLAPCSPNLLKEKCLGLVHGEDRPKVSAAMADREARQTAIDIKFRIIRADGEERWLHTRTQAARDPNGNLCGHIGFAEDVTERMNAQISINSRLHYAEMTAQFVENFGAFRNSAENLGEVARQLVESTGIAGCAIRSTLGNNRFAVAASWSVADEIQFSPVLDLTGEVERWRSFDQRLSDYFMKIEAAHCVECTAHLEFFHIPIFWKNATIGVLEICFSASACPPPNIVQFLTTTVPGLLGQWLVGQEGRSALESEVEQKSVALNVSGNMNHLRETFLSRINHELRTPLHATLGMTNLLLDTDLDRNQSEYVQVIRSSNDELLRKINHILDFQSIEETSHSTGSHNFVLSKLIDEAIDLVCSNGRNGNNAVYYSIAANANENLFGNSTRIRQVLVNLLENALNFGRDGDVTISVSRASLNTPHNSLFHFVVKDSGSGMSQSEISSALEPFYQVQNSRTQIPSGIGLGLAVSKRIVEYLEGRIWIDSAPGHGTCVNFEIPIAHSSHSQASFHRTTSVSNRNFLILASSRHQEAAIAYQIRKIGGKSFFLRSWEELVSRELTGSMTFPTVIIDEVLLAKKPRDLDLAVGISLVAISSERFHTRSLKIGGRDVWYIGSPLSRSKFRLGIDNAILSSQGPSSESDTATAVGSQSVRDLGAFPEAVEPSALRILVAEDNPVNQRLTQLQLSRLGYRADIVCNGLEAVQAVQRKSYDLVLMDIEMPEMDGIEAAKQIRSLLSVNEMPRIIAVTAYDLPADRQRCWDAGMDAFIAKPIHMPELVAHLTQCRPKKSDSSK